FPHCKFSANASTARLCLRWMLDFLLSRSFLDASRVRCAGTVRADAGIPILPVFISRLQAVKEGQAACATRDGHIGIKPVVGSTYGTGSKPPRRPLPLNG